MKTTTQRPVPKLAHKHAIRNWKPESVKAVEALNTLHNTLGLSQEAHAIRADFKYRTFRRYLQWETEPQDEYLKKLQAYLAK